MISVHGSANKKAQFMQVLSIAARKIKGSEADYNLKRQKDIQIQIKSRYDIEGRSEKII